ncbi:MAG: FecR family protein [Mangrovibacterium sp.]
MAPTRLSILNLIVRDQSRIDNPAGNYRIPGAKDKGTVLSELLKKLKEGDQNRFRINRISLYPVYRIAISTAASMVLLLLLHFLFSASRFENGSLRAQAIRFPDHSRVILNTNSSVSYSKYWWNRKVKLQGDAYFEVEKGKKFIVKTKEGEISVMGTRFQVCKNNNKLVVSCYEGMVRLKCGTLDQPIGAGFSVEYGKNKRPVLATIQVEYPEFARFKRNFSGEELRQVIAAVEEFFQIRIQLATTGLKYFSGNIETTEADTVVRIICRSLDLNYMIDPNRNIIINDKN